jgi:hypothetical protein
MRRKILTERTTPVEVFGIQRARLSDHALPDIIEDPSHFHFQNAYRCAACGSFAPIMAVVTEFTSTTTPRLPEVSSWNA